jgi:hypothetical protein
MMSPPLAGSPRVTGHRDYVIKTLLHGLTGPLDGRTYTQVMLPMGAQNDQWIAAIASYIRNEFGNSAPFVSPDDVARVRAAAGDRKAMWTAAEIEAALPRLLPVDPTWTATASHNAERAAGALTLAAWTTGVPQEPGMWLQVELPQPATVSELQFDSGQPGGRRGGRGIGRAGGRGPAGRGGGAGPAAPAPPGAQQPAAGRAGGRGGPPVFGSYPLAYRIEVSTDGRTWSAPVAEGKGSPATAIVTFRPVQAKFIRITQTGQAEDALPWSVLNFRVYGR